MPPIGATGPEVCAIVRLYLAVWHDLPSAQRQVVYRHVQSCAQCQDELRVLQRSTQMVQSLPASEPSAQLDQAILATIRARSQTANRPGLTAFPARRAKSRTRRPLGLIGGLAAAAIVIVALVISASMFMNQRLQAFALPADLSWNSYVLLSTQNLTNAKGEHYKVVAYHQMQENVINVETMMDGKLDVVVVKDQQKALGLDMMHHVAQWDAQSWVDDSTYFDLTRLRHDLSTGSAVYLGKDQFQGKDVYRIRYADGHILLLDMDYMPVNVVPPHEDDHAPMYASIQWLQPSKVPDSMWNMQVPADFRMGHLPRHP
ncbi:hypothetical protein KDA_25650 [Dictyobacter alpinus]|uniref:Zinc-finger domain-containing protein n=1 Tax=Dictyobacter alpinus TaxID=2014873 RepID=A0A402B6U1_9CHLR|nr:hypothetical protein KDA_25650 [Dictyobacter alpinus]